MLSHHLPVMFSGHEHCGCGSRDIMVSVCQMILQNHVIKGLCDFMGGSP